MNNKINKLYQALIEKSYKVKLIKKGNHWVARGMTTFFIGSGILLFANTTNIQASDIWRANSPSEVAKRISNTDVTFTFKRGDTFWAVSQVLNIKYQTLMEWNGYKAGDEYNIPVGTVIRIRDNRLTIITPDGKSILDKKITDQDRIVPNQDKSSSFVKNGKNILKDKENNIKTETPQLVEDVPNKDKGKADSTESGTVTPTETEASKNIGNQGGSTTTPEEPVDQGNTGNQGGSTTTPEEPVDQGNTGNQGGSTTTPEEPVDQGNTGNQGGSTTTPEEPVDQGNTGNQGGSTTTPEEPVDQGNTGNQGGSTTSPEQPVDQGNTGNQGGSTTTPEEPVDQGNTGNQGGSTTTPEEPEKTSVDTAPLQNVLMASTDVESQPLYYNASSDKQIAYKQKIAEARELQFKSDLTVEEMNAAIEAVKNAKEQLNGAPTDFTEADKILEDYDKKDSNPYYHNASEESKKKYDDAIQQLQKLKNTVQVTQTQVNAAIDNINKAKAQLDGKVLSPNEQAKSDAIKAFEEDVKSYQEAIKYLPAGPYKDAAQQMLQIYGLNVLPSIKTYDVAGIKYNQQMLDTWINAYLQTFSKQLQDKKDLETQVNELQKLVNTR
ncbi:LysM peptidoglycan-binding domain-containing protein, partial [Lactobacillus salivarius]|nr:LysM peptidoglycan-binding domain-containing protein [Ligilactobacillus salivarius]